MATIYGREGNSPQPGLGDYLGILRRRRWAIFLIAPLVPLAVLGVSLWMTPVYEATVTLQITDPQSAPLFKELEVLSPRPDFLASEIEFLKSRTVAEDVVRQLRLDRKVEAAAGAASVIAGPIEVEGWVQPGTYTLRFTDAEGSFEALDPDGRRLGVGKRGAPFKAGGLSFTPAEGQAKKGDEVRISLRDFQEAVGGLQGRTKVAPVRNTNVVHVKIRVQDPKEAAETANAIAENYIKSTVKRRAQQALSTREFVQRQLEPQREELRRSEEALSRYKTEKGVLTVSEEGDRVLRQVTSVEVERAKVQSQRQAAEAILGRLQSGRQNSSRPLVISAGDLPFPVLTDLAQRLTQMELELAGLRQAYTERHPSVQYLEAKIQEAGTRLNQEAHAAVNSLRERERAMAGILRQYEGEMKGLPQAELGLVGLLRTARVNQELYTFMLQKQEEARIAEASTIGSARVIDSAIPPKRPVIPRTGLNLLLGGIMGLVLGVGLALLQERLDRSVRSVRELEERANLPVFGVIPQIPNGVPNGHLHRTGSPDPLFLITQIGPRAPALEAYRSLRTNIQFAAVEDAPRSFLLTSSGPGEGKSLTVANLAIALAQMRGRVLLVDSDLRRPVLHHLFGVPRETGLTDVLVGSLAWREAVCATGVPNLDLLPSGHLPPNPPDLLGSTRMKSLIQEATAQYDMVLLDSPPALPFADASTLASIVDGVFLLVRVGVTTPEAVLRTKSMLEAVRGRILGAVLNGASLEEGFGLSRYYSYHLYNYYHPESEQRKDGWERWVQRVRRGVKRG